MADQAPEASLRPSPAPRSPRPRRAYGLLDLLIVVIVLLAIALVGVLLWSAREQTKKDEPMLGPGTFSAARDKYSFGIQAGWEVLHDDATTRVRDVNGQIPSYWMTLRPANEILDENWNCAILTRDALDVVQRAAPWPVTPLDVRVPCDDGTTEEVFGYAAVQLTEGTDQYAILVFGPLNLSTIEWVIVHTSPLTVRTSGQVTLDSFPPTLVDAMLFSRSTAKATR